MKKEKQLILKEILESGQYVVNLENGLIYDKKMKRLNPRKLPSGYLQIAIFNGKRNRQKGEDKARNGIYYVHQIVFFAANGFYDESLTINHKDRDKSNNSLSNLELATMKEQHAHMAATSTTRTRVNPSRLIRGEEIREIRRLVKEGFNQSQIAKELDLNRLTVRVIVKKIENNLPLTHENTFYTKIVKEMSS